MEEGNRVEEGWGNRREVGRERVEEIGQNLLNPLYSFSVELSFMIFKVPIQVFGLFF